MKTQLQTRLPPSTLRSFIKDDSGQSTGNLLGFAMTWFCVFFVFLMNVQLGQLFHRRDVVDHAASLAADSAKKAYCEKGESTGAAEQAAKKAMTPILDTVEGQGCNLSVRPKGSGGDDGSKELDVILECTFDCKIPVAAQFMCKGGKTKFDSKLKTVSQGCDGKGMGS
jgi:hypothetical protein